MSGATICALRVVEGANVQKGPELFLEALTKIGIGDV